MLLKATLNLLSLSNTQPMNINNLPAQHVAPLFLVTEHHVSFRIHSACVIWVDLTSPLAGGRPVTQAQVISKIHPPTTGMG